jgi:hypothetical protein
MGNVLKKLSGPSPLRGGYTAKTPDVEGLEAAASLNRFAREKRSLLVGVLVIAFVVIAVWLSLRGQYASLINDLETLYGKAGTSLAYKIALVRTYPFLRPIFFNNPSTADVVANMYYGAIANVDSSIITATGPSSVATKDQAYKPGLTCMFFPGGSNAAGSANTVFGYMEMNPQAGWSDIWNACAEKKGFTGTQSSGWNNASGAACCPESTEQWLASDAQSIFQYVVPVLGLLIMM